MKMTDEHKPYTVVVISPNRAHMDGTPLVERDCGHSHKHLKTVRRCWLNFGGKDNKNLRICHRDGTPLTPEELTAAKKIVCWEGHNDG